MHFSCIKAFSKTPPIANNLDERNEGNTVKTMNHRIGTSLRIFASTPSGNNPLEIIQPINAISIFGTGGQFGIIALEKVCKHIAYLRIDRRFNLHATGEFPNLPLRIHKLMKATGIIVKIIPYPDNIIRITSHILSVVLSPCSRIICLIQLIIKFFKFLKKSTFDITQASQIRNRLRPHNGNRYIESIIQDIIKRRNSQIQVAIRNPTDDE
ncbi:uncharacterized protein LOC106091977 [Stomoxys calcitrans]|uniref:uncharacterized protein LOC106091977 n=1 Tax=Stomoxys calcitrans TaxID=35570 RepID=UPI0027E3792C|nr:uncharacterized protein LOC106091977 [Stomoxys calcitrans]